MASWAFWSFPLHAILLISLSAAAATTPLQNETDRLALLAFKAEITDDPLQALSSWNDSLHFCEWRGVTCGRTHQRVSALNLTSLSLDGPLSPHIANLSFLTAINVSKNRFHGRVPYELGHLFRLQQLDLSFNSFQGEIPAAISNCSKLLVVDISSNSLVGKIPSELGSLSHLTRLSLYINGLSGNIPPSLGNLSSLNRLSLRRNMLDGSIPDDLGRISKLGFLQIAENNLSEYGMGGDVSTLGDVYSYGILLLELFTGRRPTEDMFNNGLSLHDFVKMAFPDRVMEIADPISNNVEGESQRVLECFASVFRVGIACSMTAPRDRMQMKEVVAVMLVIRDKLQGAGIYKQK